uniref:Uncharacterized protein n=1 Tax=Coccidioides posadasii RMSCC 3488 TaxID=454284 RepID=A0A0J6EV55_COCPO|nr:hypothetical protein CPAG_00778 [Coccidioides posadasii RMSCC 3488]
MPLLRCRSHTPPYLGPTTTNISYETGDIRQARVWHQFIYPSHHPPAVFRSDSSLIGAPFPPLQSKFLRIPTRNMLTASCHVTATDIITLAASPHSGGLKHRHYACSRLAPYRAQAAGRCHHPASPSGTLVAGWLIPLNFA